jgi:hypothetical protein
MRTLYSANEKRAIVAGNAAEMRAVNWGALRAYEPMTGAEAWRLGR